MVIFDVRGWTEGFLVIYLFYDLCLALLPVYEVGPLVSELLYIFPNSTVSFITFMHVPLFSPFFGIVYLACFSMDCSEIFAGQIPFVFCAVH